jgi:hypothetical protein
MPVNSPKYAVHRLGAGHDLTCERANSGYEIANTPVQDAGKD